MMLLFGPVARYPLRPAAGVLVLLCWLLTTTVQSAPEFPQLTGRVVDTAGLLSPTAVTRLEARLEAHEQQTGNQLVVVTLPSLGGYDIADFGYQLGRHWGIGQQDKDNGALLIVSRDDRKLRIEVGYGLEGSLTDALSSAIIQQRILPQFRNGDFEAGIELGVDAMLKILAGDADEIRELVDRRPAQTAGRLESLFVPFMIVGVFAGNLLRSRFGNGAIPVVSGVLLPVVWWFSGSLLLAVVVAIAVAVFLSGGGGGGGRRTSQGGYYGGGGYSSGGGFSGGGGSFGGGGASGGW
jgi:uncharacterized protein